MTDLGSRRDLATHHMTGQSLRHHNAHVTCSTCVHPSLHDAASAAFGATSGGTSLRLTRSFETEEVVVP
jgi:hypothetical protein